MAETKNSEAQQTKDWRPKQNICIKRTHSSDETLMSQFEVRNRNCEIIIFYLRDSSFDLNQLS